MRCIFVLLCAFAVTGCATRLDWAATGGSRADGVVRLSYEHGEFQTPQLDDTQAVNLAARRCQTWGYSGAEAFGGVTRQCNQMGGFGGCARWVVTKEFQCTGTGIQAATLIGPPQSQPSVLQAGPTAQMQTVAPTEEASTQGAPKQLDPAKRCDSCGSLSVP